MQLRAHEKFIELGYDLNIRGSTLLYEPAMIYYELGNYEKCIEMLKPAVAYHDTAYAYTHLQVLNTIGLAYRNLHKPDSALIYFYQTLHLAADKKTFLGWGSLRSIAVNIISALDNIIKHCLMWKHGTNTASSMTTSLPKAIHARP